MTDRRASLLFGAARRFLQQVSLAVLFCFVLSTTAWAAQPDPDYVGPDTCAQCHPAEAATWRDSPHARALDTIEASLQEAGADSPSLEECECLQCHTTYFQPGEDPYAHAGVTCEACHGPHVQGHPQNGVMQLQVAASPCKNCHTATYEQWHDTAHSAAEVECVSCHVPHTQATRLDGAVLCESCHREEAEHWVHHEAGVHCTDCHLSPSAVPGTGDMVLVKGEGAAPEHRFQLAVESCANCHAESIHTNVLNVASQEVEISQVKEMTERARDLARQLEDAKKTNRTLQSMSVVSLGFGLGTGGILGAIFVLVVGFVAQGRTRR